VNEYVAKAMPTLTYDQMIRATRHLTSLKFAPGAQIIQQGSAGDQFYIVTQGKVEVVLRRPNANDVVVTQYGPGQYFGEIEAVRGGVRRATIRAAEGEPVEVVVLDHETFTSLLAESDATQEVIGRQVETRLAENVARQSEA
jgi:cAMP-dependent protein kinase regulator